MRSALRLSSTLCPDGGVTDAVEQLSITRYSTLTRPDL
jgi:hypothetical protein